MAETTVGIAEIDVYFVAHRRAARVFMRREGQISDFPLMYASESDCEELIKRHAQVREDWRVCRQRVSYNVD